MPILSGKWRDLSWSRKGPKFNLHHLREISMAFKMALLTLKLGIESIHAFYFVNNQQLKTLTFQKFPKVMDWHLLRGGGLIN